MMLYNYYHAFVKINKYFFIGILFFCASNQCFSEEKQAYDLKYEISHLLNKEGAPYLKIELTIGESFLKESQDYGGLLLLLPSEWSSGKNLFENIKNLQAEDKRVKVVKGKLPEERKIFYPTSLSNIKISYEMQSDKNTLLFYQVIDKDFFHFIGHTVLAYPYSTRKNDLKVVFQWHCAKGSGNGVANSFGVSNFYQEVSMPLSNILHATYVGGGYEHRTFKIQQNEVYLVSNGSDRETINYFFDLLKKIIPNQRAFWKDEKFPYYLVVLISKNNMPRNYDGTKTMQAFSLMFNEAYPLLKKELPFFIAHENWHTWIGAKLNNSMESYTSLSWFNEGFTDYYGQVTALRSKATSFESLINKYNKVLADYYLSSVRERPNEDITMFFDKEDRFTELPYRRGTILAYELNNKIKLSSQNHYSLDNVLKDMFIEYQKTIRKNEIYNLTMVEFKKRLKKYLPDADAYIDDHVEFGKLLLPSVGSLGKCSTLEFKKIKLKNYGIDLRRTLFERKVIGLDLESFAYQKGLRDGQDILDYRIDYTDINEPVVIKVLIEGKPEWVTLTRRGAVISVPQYRLNKTLYEKDPQGCLEHFTES